MKAETTLPRPFGDYLLVAQLGDDPLGSVYRAIHSSDEKRFLRLRVLQSGELSPRAVITTVRKLEARGSELAHDGIVRRPQFGVIGEAPYMAWYETAGWTLDRVLTMARAAKAPVTTEYAILLGERLIQAMEAATRFLAADLVPHALLWPGFVSISNDAEVRIAGFGLAKAALPALPKPRMLREVAPYIAPEARDRRHPGPSSDVYSLAIMLLELLTGRRPALGSPLPELRAGDPFSKEIGAFLRKALAPPEERYSSIEEMRLALQETLLSAPRLLYPAGLAFYLYRLLNPEINSIAPADPDSTNPIETDPRLSSAMHQSALAQPEVDAGAIDLPAEVAWAFPETDESADERGPLGLAADTAPPEPVFEASESLPAQFDPEAPRPKLPPGDADLLESARLRPRVRTRGTAALLVLAGTIFGLALLIDNERARHSPLSALPPPSAARVSAAARRASEPSPAAAPSEAILSQPESGKEDSLEKTDARSPDQPRGAPTLPGRPTRASLRNRQRESEEARKSAEDLRFQAGMARVAAERIDGPQMASESFRAGSEREKEGVAQYRLGQYEAARDAFAEAARLFREAETISHEEHVRLVKLSPAP